MMSGHKDPKTVMRHDHHRENLDLNPVNHLNYGEKAEKKGEMQPSFVRKSRLLKTIFDSLSIPFLA
jgi:hypothetical protein